MNATITTANPTFHALTGRQPVGQTQVAVQADYASTVTTVKRCNDTYWVVVTRDARNAFSNPTIGASCAIWVDPNTMEFVVDYYDGPTNVEADRTRGLRAAIGVAASVTARRWLDQYTTRDEVR